MTKYKNILKVFGLGLVLLGLFLVRPARAASITVTAGAIDQTTNGNCSLYEAIEAADTDSPVDACVAGSGADTITVPDGVYDLSINFFGPTISSDITLDGQSRSGTILDGGGDYDLAITNTGVVPTVTIKDLTVRNGSTGINAGHNDMNLHFDNVLVYGNAASSGPSGIYALADTDGTNYGTFSMTNSIVHDNSGNSGGLSVAGYESITISDSQFYENEDAADSGSHAALELKATTISLTDIESSSNQDLGISVSGADISLERVVSRNNTYGGILATNGTSGDDTALSFSGNALSVVSNAGPSGLATACDGATLCELNISNTTIADNTSLYPAFFSNNRENFPTTGTFYNVTIADNLRTGDVGGMPIPAGMIANNTNSIAPTVDMQNVLLANNFSDSDESNCAAPFMTFNNFPSGGHNFSSDNTCDDIFDQTGDGDVNGVDAELGPLGTAGSTWVVPPTEGSPVIDAGATLGSVTADQIGTSRPQCSGYDIGAYEFTDGVDGSCTGGGGGSGDDATLSNAVDGKPVRISSSIGTFTASNAVAPDGLPGDGNKVYPLGLVGYTLEVTPGATATITIRFVTSLTPGQVAARKYNGTTLTYGDIPGATLTASTYSGQPAVMITYDITDGGALDQDGAANGTIVDPVGLATTGSATLADTGENQRAITVLAGTVVLAGILLLVYRRQRKV